MRRLFKVGQDRHDVGPVRFSWHPTGNLLASAGKNGIVQITDRHGDIVDEIPLPTQAPVLSLAWDKDGEYLAILQDGNGVVPLWSLSSKRVVPLETNLKDPTFLAWSKTGPQLAIGTAKGNLLIYNKTKKVKVPIVGKHAKKICTGDWSTDGKLVLGSEDKTLTISNENGDTLLHTEVKYAPVESYFTSSLSVSRKSGAEPTLSANLDGKSILLFDLNDDKEDPIELTFGGASNGAGCKYGDIKAHTWFEDGMVMVGFSGGHLLVISAHPKELGKEKFCTKFHNGSFITFAYNSHMKRAASAGDDGVRIIDIRDFRESTADFIPPEDLENGRISALAWSPDGQILTVGTNAGNVYNFLAKMPVLNAKYGSTAAYLSSLREVTVQDVLRRSNPIDVTLKLEPSLLAVGATHVAAGMNNKVYYHRIATSANAQHVHEQEYVGTVREVQLNKSYAVVLTDSKATLHPIEGGPKAQERTRIFPTRDEGTYSKINCVALTDDFLYYGTEAGTVEVFYLGEFVLLANAELRLDHPIKQLFPNASGTRLVIVDAAHRVYLYNPGLGGGGGGDPREFKDPPENIVTALWDVKEKNVVHLYDGRYAHSYVYLFATRAGGSAILKIGPVEISAIGEITMKPDKIEVPLGNTPILSIGGVLTCQTVSGSLNTIIHPYFDHMPETLATVASATRQRHGDKGAEQASDKKSSLTRFCQAIALLKLEHAWQVHCLPHPPARPAPSPRRPRVVASSVHAHHSPFPAPCLPSLHGQAALDLDKKQYWLALSNKAMEMLNVELAMRVYRQLGDAGMVMALQVRS
jgi:WD repeat-containing protein 19